MKKIIAVLLLLFLLFPVPVSAQSNCPDYATPLNPSPAGTIPSDVELCTNPTEAGMITIHSDSETPCGQVVLFETNFASNINNQHDTLTIVPPVGQTFPSGIMKLAFQFSARNYLGQPLNNPVTALIRSYNSAGVEIGSVSSVLTNFTSVVSTYGEKYYLVELLLTFEQGGFIEFLVTDPPPYQLNDYSIGSLNIIDGSAVPPVWCPVAGSTIPTPTPVPTLPPTYTPVPPGPLTPSPTPLSTWTPSPTPQSFPTAPGGTPSPAPTQTPYAINTSSAPLTPTPIPPPDLPSISLPGVTVPDVPNYSTPLPLSVALTPNATAQAQLDDIQGMTDDMSALATRVGVTTTIMLQTLSVTNTFGVSSTTEMADRFGEVVAEYNPISYYISLEELIPNMYAVLSVILLAFFWKTFFRFAGFIIGFVSDVLINIWQQFPFT